MNRFEEWADYLDPSVTHPSAPHPSASDASDLDMSIDSALTAAERDALDRIRASLHDESTWSEPPASLRASLLERVAREAAAGRGPAAQPDVGSWSTEQPASEPPSAGQPASEPQSSEQRPPALTVVPGEGADARPARSPRVGRRPRATWWLSIAGVAAAAALVAVLAWPRTPTTGPITTFALAGPTATATADLENKSAGMAITLHIKGLKPAPPGDYYAAWVKGPNGDVVPVGTFHWHKGGIPINLWSGVPSDRYPVLIVTLQQEGQPPTPSTTIVLSGHVGQAPASS